MMPGLVQIPAGNPPNAYGYNDECLNKNFTLGVIRETNEFYRALKSGARINDQEKSLT